MKQNNIQNEIVLIRGLPGSGKSTAAKQMKNFRHLEADMYFETDSAYVYDASKVKTAHDWCVAQAKQSLGQGLNVVVSNTFVKIWEMQRYIELGYPFRIIEMNGKYPNIHGVTEQVINQMASGWQKIPASFNMKNTVLNY
jgi:tRNA uridine 5-carbamoylmethylation protein Kti12